MATNKKYPISRRNFIKVSAATTAGVSMIPFNSLGREKYPAPMKRKFGNLGFEVTTIGLGGQASLQWTPEDVDPVPIILKAFELGINYYDTSNLYADSQLNYNKAFQQLNLIPGKPGYDAKLRESIWLTSKTAMRWGKPGWSEKENVRNWSNGKEVKCAVDDVKRSLTQLFGDNKGWYPEGSYLDMVLIHTLHNTNEVDILYKGLETPLNPDENFGALVALRDLRDGTNLTGMNPKKEKLIRHIGFSGHAHPPAMMDMIQRDEFGILDGMLVAINANDKTKMNMQHNVIPVAEAKGMGIIGMKVFADAAMYHKKTDWSREPKDVYRKVGSAELPSQPLIEYALTTPGVHTLIIGIGQIDDDPMKDQLVQNFYAAQIKQNGLSKKEREKIEQHASKIKDGKTNYFQAVEKEGVTPPQNVRTEKNNDKTKIIWDTAYAGDFPLSHYEIVINGQKKGEVKHAPQTLKSKPFVYEANANAEDIELIAVDEAGNQAKTNLT